MNQALGRVIRVTVLLLASLMFTNIQAAGVTVRLDNDTNSRLDVGNAVTHGDTTTLLFWSWPYLGDPNHGTDCSVRLYTVTLTPGLSDLEPRQVAQDACPGNVFHAAALDADLRVHVMVAEGVETWRGNDHQETRPWSGQKVLTSLRANSHAEPHQLSAFSANGGMVLSSAITGYNRSAWKDVGTVVLGLQPSLEQRWQATLPSGDGAVDAKQIWAGAQGNALLHGVVVVNNGLVPEPMDQLLAVDAQGGVHELSLLEQGGQVEVTAVEPGKMDELRRLMEMQSEQRSEVLEQMAVQPRQDGGFDVLIQRESQDAARHGHFLLDISPSGELRDSIHLGDRVEGWGLADWTDFYRDGRTLVLLSSAAVKQATASRHRSRLMQNILSRLELDSDHLETRLVPLDERFVEAALNTGDEGLQYLEGRPGGHALKLVRVGDTPVSVARGFLQGRQTLRLYELTPDLAHNDSFIKAHQAELQKAERSEQRKAARESSKQAIASAGGFTLEEYENMSQEEKLAFMSDPANQQKMMQAAMSQMQAAQQGMSPEQAAQMQKMMGQAMPGAAPAPAKPVSTPAPAGTVTGSFTLDPLSRGHLRYENPAGGMVHLRLLDGPGGELLLEREFPDGSIDEFINLGALDAPADAVVAELLDGQGRVLETLPVTRP